MPGEVGRPSSDLDKRSVFLSYAPEDRGLPQVGRLRERLLAEGERILLNESTAQSHVQVGDKIESIGGSDNFYDETPRYFLLCISQARMARLEFDEELTSIMRLPSRATDHLNIVVLRLDSVELPQELGRWVDIDINDVALAQWLVGVLRTGHAVPARRPRSGWEWREVLGRHLEARKSRPGVPYDGIFISYRRLDEPAFSGRLSDWFTAAFGQDMIFMDVDNIAPGRDFAVALEEALENCCMMVVVIGDRWLRMAYSDGRRRIDDRNDYVRREIVTALRRKVMLLPILVEDAVFPMNYELPPSLRPLVRMQHYRMHNASFIRDCEALIQKMRVMMMENQARHSRER